MTKVMPKPPEHRSKLGEAVARGELVGSVALFEGARRGWITPDRAAHTGCWNPWHAPARSIAPRGPSFASPLVSDPGEHAGDQEDAQLRAQAMEPER